mmetsp:Transcript_12039/g.48289  ORF Transcript_12039/g.48289 Transcript_12039/m.48289 type:complete len:397 (+) Transcript_12039:109-1299(+)
MTTRRALGLFASRLTSNRRSVGALNTSTCFSTAAGSDASSFVDVEAAQERARLKAAALAAQAQADGGAMYVFDRTVKAAHRDRAAYLRRIHPSGDTTDPFLEEIARRTLDRLSDVKREFPRVLVLGGAGDAAVRRLLRDRGDVRVIVVTDMSRDMLRLVRDNVAAEFSVAGGGEGGDSLESQVVRSASGGEVAVHYVHADEEELPAKGQSVDVVVSVLGLHWANDLPGAMTQARMALVPDGLFLCAVLGGETLREMRISCAVAELEREGGVSQRVSPLAQVRDCGNLLTRAGMRLPAVDVDTVTMNYPSPHKLVEHLRVMGETNAGVSRRRGPLGRSTAAAAAAAYGSAFPSPPGVGDTAGGGGRGRAAAHAHAPAPHAPHDHVRDVPERGERRGR